MIEPNDKDQFRSSELIVDEFIHRLDVVSRAQRSNSRIIGSLTILNFACFLVSVAFGIGSPVSERFHLDAVLDFLPIYSMIVMLYVILKLYIFDKTSQEGHLLYQEISDELEWGEVKKKISLPVRYVMRQFLLDDTLPFYRSGRNGPMFYSLFNVAIFLLVIFLNNFTSIKKF